MSLSTLARSTAAVVIGLALLASASRARAAEQRTDPGAAEALFRDARALLAAGKVELACARFEESYRLDPAPGTLLNVADCSRRAGKSATAWGQFVEAARVFRRRNEERRAQFADQEAKKLEPTLAHLIVEAEAPPEDLVVSRGGAEIGPSALGTKLPIDPGDVLVEARASGRKPYAIRVNVASKKTVSVRIPRLELAPAPAPAASPRNTIAPDGAPVGEAQRLVGYVVGGVGLASLLAGGAFAGLTAERAGALEQLCPNQRCTTDEGRSALDAANLYANVANGTLLGGGVLLTAGLVLALTAPSAEEGDIATSSSTDLIVRPRIGLGWLGVDCAF
jgi:hypothetical protein